MGKIKTQIDRIAGAETTSRTAGSALENITEGTGGPVTDLVVTDSITLGETTINETDLNKIIDAAEETDPTFETVNAYKLNIKHQTGFHTTEDWITIGPDDIQVGNTDVQPFKTTISDSSIEVGGIHIDGADNTITIGSTTLTEQQLIALLALLN